MSSTVSRRQFLRLSVAGLACAPLAGFAVPPPDRKGPPPLRLRLAAYSFRDYCKDSDQQRDVETDATKRIDLFRFVDYCGEQGCDGTELTSYYFPKDTDEAFLVKLRRHCFLRGVE